MEEFQGKYRTGLVLDVECLCGVALGCAISSTAIATVVTLVIQLCLSGPGKLLEFKYLEDYYFQHPLITERKTKGDLPIERKVGLIEEEGRHLPILTESNPRRKSEPVASSAFLKGKVQSYAMSTY